MQRVALSDDDDDVVVNVKDSVFSSRITALTFIAPPPPPARRAIANIWTDAPAAVHAHGLAHTWEGRTREGIEMRKMRGSRGDGNDEEKNERRTFLAAPPGVSLRTGADGVPHADAPVLTGRSAYSCKEEEEEGNTTSRRAHATSDRPGLKPGLT